MPLQTFTPSRDAETGPSPYKWVIGRIAVEGYGDGNGTKEILAGAQMVPEKFRDPRKIKNPFSLLANEPVNFA